MGKYTIHGPEVDNQIEPMLNSIVSKIVEQIPGVESVVLTGGFGRGEGSVVVESGVVRPIKDFDFMLFFSKEVPLNHIAKAQDSIRNEFRRGNSCSDPYSYRTFTVDFNATTIDRMNLFPDIIPYECKVASRVLYGKDLRDKIRLRKEDIPPGSGARILFQKGTSLIGQMNFSFLKNGSVPAEVAEMFTYECTRVFVELGTSLSILGKVYEPSYQKRGIIFENDYPRLFPELHRRLPELGQKIASYTAFKLAPDFSAFEDPIALWLDARRCLIEMFRYYMDTYLGVRETDWLEFCKRVRGRLKREYYLPVMERALAARLGIHLHPRLLSLVNGLYQLYSNLQYTRDVASDKEYRNSRILRNPFCSPYVRFWYATLLILESLHSDASFDGESLALARKALALEARHSQDSGNNPWEDTRLMYLASLRLVSHLV